MTQIVSGKQMAENIAERIKNELVLLNEKVVLGIVRVGDNEVTKSYVNRKRKYAESVGIKLVEKSLAENISQEELEKEVSVFEQEVNSLVVQLPLPQHINSEKVLALIPSIKDADALNPNTKEVMAPVAAAVLEILLTHKVALEGSKCVVVGNGKLVGQPTAKALTKNGALVKVLDINTPEAEFAKSLAGASIIVSGVGKPNIITANMVKEGVVLIDAGTSSANGVLLGDVSLECETKANLFSKTPGGVGPVAVAKLFENAVALVKKQKQEL